MGAFVWEDPAVRRGVAAQLARLDEQLARGAGLVGWKVGVGAPASMRTAGITAPLVGFLTSHTLLADGATVDARTWVTPVLEAELAIHVGRDVPAGATIDQAAEAITAVAPAIELADVDVPLSDLEAVVAGDIFHRHVILGSRRQARSGNQVDDLRVAVIAGREQVAATDDVTALTGTPAQLVTHVASWLAAVGRRLEAGQLIIGGAVVPIVPVEAGQTLTYRCDPLGALTVTFAR